MTNSLFLLLFAFIPNTLGRFVDKFLKFTYYAESEIGMNFINVALGYGVFLGLTLIWVVSEYTHKHNWRLDVDVSFT